MVRVRSLIAVLFASLYLTGCAGLMMHVDELSDKGGDIELKHDSQVRVEIADVTEVIKNESGPATKNFAANLEKKIADALTEQNGVKVNSKATVLLKVKITKFERGNVFCRGFFPVFGLGMSHLDGEVTLVTKAGSRKILVQKVGQKSGLFNMNDQTAENMSYFATVVANEFAASGKKKKNKDN